MQQHVALTREAIEGEHLQLSVARKRPIVTNAVNPGTTQRNRSRDTTWGHGSSIGNMDGHSSCWNTTIIRSPYGIEPVSKNGESITMQLVSTSHRTTEVHSDHSSHVRPIKLLQRRCDTSVDFDCHVGWDDVGTARASSFGSATAFAGAIDKGFQFVKIGFICKSV